MKSSCLGLRYRFFHGGYKQAVAVVTGYVELRFSPYFCQAVGALIGRFLFGFGERGTIKSIVGQKLAIGRIQVRLRSPVLEQSGMINFSDIF